MTEPDITRLIKIDEVSLRLENLNYELLNYVGVQQEKVDRRKERIQEQIKYNNKLYHLLTGADFVYNPQGVANVR